MNRRTEARARAKPRRDAERRRRELLVHLLEGDRAHAPLSAALREFPRELRALRPRGAPHTPWELLEHLRIAQHDILAFGRDPAHESPPWPDGYWPASAAPPDERAWGRSVRAFLRDLAALKRIAREEPDLERTLPGTTTSWLGQICLAASHASYHLGQLFFLRRTLAGLRRARRRRP